MKKMYQEIEIMLIALLQEDVITTSSKNEFDDVTEWDSAWDGLFE